ncbi:hypothetical protein [Marinibacterium sp. SX1]|uniref:hypothetical protein n=1 Tax=Marinibacterium sp. SX1 TaxID=3388424 RepID=UPI003D167BBD
MFNFSTDPTIRHYIDVAHAERSRAITGSFRKVFRALNPVNWVQKGPVLANRPT